MLHALRVDFRLQNVGIDRCRRRAGARWEREIVDSRGQRFVPSLHDQIAMTLGLWGKRDHAVGILWIGSESPRAFKYHVNILGRDRLGLSRRGSRWLWG